jgi:DNA replication protein DnaC
MPRGLYWHFVDIVWMFLFPLLYFDRCIDVLVIDDWVMAPLSEPERRDFWEICEDRYQVRSTVLTSQLPVSRWHEQIGDPTLADGILDRLVHNAHRIEMRGDSMRKNRGKPNT